MTYPLFLFALICENPRLKFLFSAADQRGFSRIKTWGHPLTLKANKKVEKTFEFIVIPSGLSKPPLSIRKARRDDGFLLQSFLKGFRPSRCLF